MKKYVFWCNDAVMTVPKTFGNLALI